MFDYQPPTNTYVLNSDAVVEMLRLIELDQMTTRGMGGPWQDGLDLPPGSQIVDIACGPGGWVLDMAFTNPQIEVAGIDISPSMISYANARAQAHCLKNASFGVMDVTVPLDFADNTFAVVNGRLLSSFLKRDAWLPLLKECLRILQPGGMLRLTETDNGGVTTSPAFEQLNALLFRAMQREGYGFACDGQATLAITPMLERLLQQTGLTTLQRQAHAIATSREAEAWDNFSKNTEIVFTDALPFIVRMDLITKEEGKRLYERMMMEMQQEDFAGIWNLLSVWGTKP